MVAVLLLSLASVVTGDFSLECEEGYRISSIKRAPSYYHAFALTNVGLGALSIECEQIASPAETSCDSQPSLPQCSGQLEGCAGSQWLGGLHVFQVENTTKAVVLDPICCSSPHVRIVPGSCIHDQLNEAVEPFDHSLVSDLIYRGMQCWHQVDQNNTLVDLVWKVETCAFESEQFPPVETEVACEECACECGPHQCSTGEHPIRVVHKRRILPCDCDCTCVFKCL